MLGTGDSAIFVTVVGMDEMELHGRCGGVDEEEGKGCDGQEEGRDDGGEKGVVEEDVRVADV